MSTDVTDATFERNVLDRSTQVPVVVDLWAEWCGPCLTLGPILERVVGETNGGVELVKIDVDTNPRASATFQVQSIPAVFALKDRKIVDSFIGALPEAKVRDFVAGLAPVATVADGLAATGDEDSLRQALEVEPDHPGAVLGLAELLAERGDGEEALALLTRIPESPEWRRVAALARVGPAGAEANGDLSARLDGLLERVKQDDSARQEFVDLLELLGPDDPRTPHYRRALAARLY